MTTVQLKDRSGCTLTLKEVDGKYFPNFDTDHLKNYRKLPVQDGDIFLCAYPKSGTHWLWEVIMMLHHGKPETITFKKSLQMVEFNAVGDMAAASPPRVFNTHVYYEDLPTAVLEPPRSTRLVLVLRNPKDVAVSFFNHHKKLSVYYGYEGNFGDWLELFLEGKVDSGLWFEYVKSWEKIMSAKDVNPLLVIMYEDMKEDPVRETTRLAEFLGMTHDPELIKQIADKCDFSRMVEDKKPVQDHAGIMFRKGMVGDWKNTFTVAQSEAFDAVFEKQMKDSKLKFRFML